MDSMAFRARSFCQRQLAKNSSDISEDALDQVADSLNKVQKMGHFEDYLHSAALTIQKRYHGWKGRKDFLRICNRIVKVQLLVHTECILLAARSCLSCRVNSYCLCPWCPCRVNAREVVDTSGGCGASFVVEIVSEEFEGKRLLERHRMVNAALEEEMKEIHALSFKKAVIPEQWKQLQQDSNQANPAA
ncbi:hypothetical protein Ahy_B05g076708 [Arachis hypogaea]|uniref:Uncharacterized protein n=1 Tax=Arachis hypogaea TaxID=3818 RepID=A0A444Z3W0_ARAHY|nr:hypothetical protein Ahy_B05g076708 [Arachis hypogaea]